MAETTSTGRAEAKGSEPDANSHVCPVAFCPVGFALSAAQGVGPDALDHLLSAAREFFLAARAVVDIRAGDFEENEPGSTGLHRIDIG